VESIQGQNTTSKAISRRLAVQCSHSKNNRSLSSLSLRHTRSRRRHCKLPSPPHSLRHPRPPGRYVPNPTSRTPRGRRVHNLHHLWASMVPRVLPSFTSPPLSLPSIIIPPLLVPPSNPHLWRYNNCRRQLRLRDPFPPRSLHPRSG